MYTCMRAILFLDSTAKWVIWNLHTLLNMEISQRQPQFNFNIHLLSENKTRIEPIFHMAS